MLLPMHSVPPIFSFQVNNTQTISGQFSTIAAKEISVDWGDGSARSTYSGTDQAWSKDYGSAGDRTVRIFGSVVLTKFKMDAAVANISFDVANLPTSLTVFWCDGYNTCHGNIGSLPASLTYFRCYGYNTCHGNIGSLPASLTVFWCYGYNTCHGNIGSLPASLTYFRCYGYNTIADYTGKTWTTKPTTFILIPVGVGGLSTAEVDQLFIDFDDDLVWAGGDMITLTGTNAAPSIASATARTNIANEGCTITTN